MIHRLANAFGRGTAQFGGDAVKSRLARSSNYWIADVRISEPPVSALTGESR
jgi:hypothetical protein